MLDLGGLSRSRRAVVVGWFAVAAAGLLVLIAHLGGGVGGRPLNRAVDQWLGDGLELLAAAGCLLRAAWVREERLEWTLLGFGVLSFAIGDLLFDFVYDGNPPTPSAADLFYLGFYPCCYAALLLLIASRISTFNRSVWLDGLIAALASGAVGAAVLFETVLTNTSGRPLTVAVDLTYPLADVVLLALTVFAFAVSGWHPGREWTTLGLALLTLTLADSIYLLLSAEGSYREGTRLDALWPAGLLLIAAAGWRPRDRVERVELEGRFLGAIPIGCGFVALAVLLDGYLRGRLNPLAVALAIATVTTVFVRTALSFGDNTRLLERTRSQSLTDALTGVGNRRKLMLELERALAGATVEPELLVILDLNGFKGYNDRFGHPSGDALLARLATNLATAFHGQGSVYRLGGDEFCVFAPIANSDAETLIDRSLHALSESGEGFAITASCGATILPDEASDPRNALRIADQRLYAHKADHYRSRGESYQVLTRVLDEREPQLRQHHLEVAELAVRLGHRLGLTEPELTQLRLAAELHDVGKLAIPDTILNKPDTLDPSEWEFIRRHTTIGQRILAGAPALQDVGAIVRSTHERWDGTGYPDGLSGNTIPQPARIIAICDAYTAMTTDRPYRRAIDPDDALTELRRCAGTQFDPNLVTEFCRIISATPTRRT